MTGAIADSTCLGEEGLLRSLRQALRSAPAFRRAARFPLGWWRHLGERGLLGLSFDLDGRGPRADWRVSNGPAADAFVVRAVSGADGQRKAFVAFLVESGTPGLSVQPAGIGAGLAGPPRPPLVPLQHAALQLEACSVAARSGPARRGPLVHTGLCPNRRRS